jgi:capsular exopolysaccharide synthesis family protein
MSDSQNINLQEENDLKKIAVLIIRNYKLFSACLIIALALAYMWNRFSIPIYKISSSILIKQDTKHSGGSGSTDFLNSSLFSMNQNFQNELWVLKSSPVFEQTIKNLDLSVSYYRKEGFQYLDAYKNTPFHIVFQRNHVQPVNVRFFISFVNKDYFQIRAESGKASFYIFENNEIKYNKENWSFLKNGKIGELIETPDLSFIVELESNVNAIYNESSWFGFEFRDIPSLVTLYKSKFQFNSIDKLATVVELSLKDESLLKGTDFVNELMQVYSQQNLDRKNHTASITIDYIEKQLNEISDSLNQTETNLANFRSSNQLLNITEQANGISKQYIDLQNKLAELVSRKKYYDYVSDYLSKNDNFSDMIVPASIGISDQLLNNLMTELIAAQAQQSNLIKNNQEKNPLVPRLGIQIQNIKKTISENISAAGKTTGISINEMNKRIKKTETEISKLPATQRRLGSIERKYRLNDAIYNYMLEKRAEAKITKASNLPDDIIIEPAQMEGLLPVSPNKIINYILALLIGFFIPFIILQLRMNLKTTISSQEDIENITNTTVLGKVFHYNNRNEKNVFISSPNDKTAETFRTLRTNLNFAMNGKSNKTILVSSCVSGEGKTFSALNIAAAFAQMGKKTILLDFDLRNSHSLIKNADNTNGISLFLSGETSLDEVIQNAYFKNLDIINSGPIPPNPFELMENDIAAKLFEFLKKNYDYIIIDTPPMAQVSDAFSVIQHADLNLIVTRYNVTKKKLLRLVLSELKNKNISNVYLILNDNKLVSEQMGYGYYSKK